MPDRQNVCASKFDFFVSSHTNSESSGSEKEVEGAGVNIPTLEVHQCQVLAEMFPNACAMEVSGLRPLKTVQGSLRGPFSFNFFHLSPFRT